MSYKMRLFQEYDVVKLNKMYIRQNNVVLIHKTMTGTR